MRYQGFSGGRGTGFRIGPGGLSPFIKWMMIANGGMFLLQMMSGQVTYNLALAPARFFADFPNLLYQPFTYMFLHGGFGHIFFNMFALWMFGTEIERTWGTRTFGKFYMLAGLAGAALTMIVYPGQTVPIVGASGAIYGVLIAYWLMFPDRQLYLYFLFPIRVKWAIPGLMLLGFLFGNANIAHMVHLGGAIFGFIYLKADWRVISLSQKVKNLRHKRQETKLQKNREKAEEVMKRVDAILDKINDVGIENLTKAERKLLEDASDHLSEKEK